MRGRAEQRARAVQPGRWRRARWLLLVAALLLGALAAPGVALSQEEDEKEDAEIKAFTRKKDERQKAEVQKGPNFKAKADERAISLEGGRKRDEAIRLLRELIDSSDKTDPEKPKYLFQLAESVWAKSKFNEQNAFKIQDQMYGARDRGDKAAEERYKGQMQDELREAVRQREEAVKVYVQIITDHPTYEKLPEVYFYLGVNLIEIDKRPQALQIFRKLLQEYPTTPYTPNVLLAFGEYYFDNDDMGQAMKAYQKVLDFPQSDLHTYATYKLAWCHYNQAEYDKALETFLSVVKATSGSGKKNDQSLRKEALRDVVLTYSHIGKASKALPFFDKLVKEKSDVFYMGESLAQLYADSGQFDESTDLFRELIKLNKSSYKIVSYQLEIIRNVEPRGNKVDVVREILRAAKLLEVASKFNDAKSEEVNQNRDRMELILREYATTYHREAQKTRSEETYALAYELYKQYLEVYPQSPDRYVMTFFYAELLYRLKKYDEAAQRYKEVTELKPEGEYSGESAHGEVLSLQKLIEVDDTGKTKGGDVQIPDPTKPNESKEPVAGPPSPVEIPPLKKQLIEACDRYARIAPNAQTIVKVKYTAAWVYYDHLHLDEAIKRFSALVKDHTSDRLAIISADLHLDALYLKRDYEGLTNTVEVYRANEVLGRDNEFIARLDGIAERLQFQRCFDMEGRKEWEAAARCFTQDFYRKFPESELVDKALYNAAFDYERVRQIGKAIQVRKGLLQLRGDSPLAKDTLFNIGGNYHAIAVYSEASKYYELFVQYFAEADPQKAEEALRNAATFRHGLGEYEEAVKNYERYLALFPDKKDKAAEVKFQIAKIYDGEGKIKDAFDSYNDYLRNWSKQGKIDRALEARVRIGMIHWEGGRQKQGLDEFQQVLKIYEGLRDAQRDELTTGADAAAQARFMVGEAKLKEMEAIKLKLPEKVLQQRLVEKIQKLEEASGIYKSVFKYGRPDWTLAALYRIGYVAQSFAKEIRNSPVPSGLTSDQEELYKGALEEQASNIEAKAIESYTDCLNVARQKSWFNEFSTKAEVALAGLQPKQYRKPSELRAKPDKAPSGFARAPFLEKALADQEEKVIGGEE